MFHCQLIITTKTSLFQVNKPACAPPTEECYSDVAHTWLLSSRVKVHDGVWLVNDNIRVHDTVMVKLTVRTFSNLSLSLAI